MKPQTILVIPDTHVSTPDSVEGGIDPQAESVLFQAIPIIKPTMAVHIGDIGEWESVSHWQWKKRKRPPSEYILPRIDREAAAVNAWLDKLEGALDDVGCSKILVTQGNHEVWTDDFALEETRPEYEARVLLKAKKRGYEWHDHGQYAKVGKLHFTHGGHFTGLHHAYKTATGLSASSMYGHFHSLEHAHVSKLGGKYGAWCIGSLCKLNKRFLGGRPTNWAHAITVVHMESDGTFNVEIIEIFEGRAFVYGKKVVAK